MSPAHGLPSPMHPPQFAHAWNQVPDVVAESVGAAIIRLAGLAALSADVTTIAASRSSPSWTSRTCDAIPRCIKIVTYPVPGRIRVPDRIIQPIAISIQSLRVGNHWNDRVRLDELSDGWIVPPGAIVIQPAQALLPLPGVAVIRRRRAPGEAGC